MYKKDEKSVEKKGNMSVRRHSGQMNFGMIVLILGILIMLAVLAIKFTASGETDEFMGITNPEGVYGEYFMSGMVVGLVVLIIGAVLSRKKEREPLFDEEEVEEEELDFGEEEEEGICPTCGAIISVTCTECPECGEELEPPEEEIAEESECPICGAALSSDATECPECGEPVSEGEEADEDDLFADLDEL